MVPLLDRMVFSSSVFGGCVSNFDHCRPQQALTKAITRLKYLDDRPTRRAWLCRYRLVHGWVEKLTERFKLRHTGAVKNARKFPFDKLDSLHPARLALLGWYGAQCALEVILYWQNLSEQLPADKFTDQRSLLFGAPPEIRELSATSLNLIQICVALSDYRVHIEIERRLPILR